MKRWIELAAAFYPRCWRDQYGKEFRALLDDVKPGWRVFANVLTGAIEMQMTKGTNWLKVLAAAAVLGMIAGAVVSYQAPRRYVSSAVIQVSPQLDPLRQASPQALQERAIAHVMQMAQEVVSRSSATSIITDRSLDLYRAERQTEPIEDIVMHMRSEIQVQVLPPSTANSGVAPMAFRISFAYPDQVKAQAVLRVLIAKFTEQNVTVLRNQRQMWNLFWQHQVNALRVKEVPPPPAGENLAILSPASFPQKPAGPGLATFLAAGLGAGLLVGVMTVLALRRPQRSLQLAGFAAAGCALAGVVSFLIPDRYTSTAVLQITPSLITENPLDTPGAERAKQRLTKLKPAVLTRSRLAAIIQDPNLDLYPGERAKEPLEEIVQRMRDHDIHIAPVDAAPTPGTAFGVSFTYSDPYKAQAVVRELITGFTEVNVTEARAEAADGSPVVRDIVEHRVGENLEVLNPASLPAHPNISRLAVAAVGLVLGLLLGAVTLRLSSSRHTALPAM